MYGIRFARNKLFLRLRSPLYMFFSYECFLCIKELFFLLTWLDYFKDLILSKQNLENLRYLITLNNNINWHFAVAIHKNRGETNPQTLRSDSIYLDEFEIKCWTKLARLSRIAFILITVVQCELRGQKLVRLEIKLFKKIIKTLSSICMVKIFRNQLLIQICRFYGKLF